MGKNVAVCAWMEGGTSPSNEPKSQDVNEWRSLPEVTKSPCVQEPKSNDTQFLSFNKNCRVQQEGGTTGQSSALLLSVTWSAHPAAIRHMWARPWAGGWADMGEQNLVSVLMEP